MPLLLLLHGFAAFDNLTPGVADWNNAVASLHIGVLLSGPLVAGIGAFTATRERRRKLEYLRVLSARHPAAGPAAELTAVVLWALVGYAIVTAAVLVTTASNSGWGSPHLLWLATGAGGLALHAVLGYLVGRLWPRVWVAPAIAVLTYLLATAIQGQPNAGYYFLSTVTTRPADAFHTLNSALFAGQLAWYVGLAASLVLLWAAGLTARGRGHLLAASGLAVAVTATGASSVYGSETRALIDKRTPVEYRCTPAQPTVCVHPVFRPGLPELAAAFARLDRRTRGTPLEFDRVEQRPYRLLSRFPSEARVFAVDDLGAGYVTRALTSYVSHQLDSRSPRCQSPPPGGDNEQAAKRDWLTSVQLNQVVVSWLTETRTGALGIPAVARSADWFGTLSESEKRTWLAEHFQRFATCQLDPADFRGRTA
ncbi:hypothetical protein B0I33_102507 [Prauserella shujinwangii]|uniref:Uncharacterized protein n=1 Tax=Prauserella shujinwangii TaxID=1453103 RepID=A0A2T0M1A5_9PSEU|nr:hypothetical protein B0I33_102507 [Prauserella shujinwangii]